jgi:uncharacterized protein (TIGR01244 family)
MSTTKTVLCLLIIVTMSISVAVAQSQVKKQTVEGITNFATVESTVACAGAITPASVAGIKKMGFNSIINLRQATEQGANIEAEAAAAKAAGINFIHIPFNGAQPETAAVDQFVKSISLPANNPSFVHCGSGNRAAAMWFVKRALVDKWDNDRAMAEATELGLANQALKNFMIEYVKTHR